MINDATTSTVLDSVSGHPARGPELRAFAMSQLAGIDGYDWCGVYRLEGDTLVLDEFFGAATEHDRIKVGVGVCGTAVAENENQVVVDVRDLDNYLACSAFARSEIVVLIRRVGDVLGQIDVDGHKVGAFDASDERFLDSLALILANRWE